MPNSIAPLSAAGCSEKRRARGGWLPNVRGSLWNCAPTHNMRRNNAQICAKHIYSHLPLPRMLSVPAECIVTVADRGALQRTVCPTHLSITLRQCEAAIWLTSPQHVCFYTAGTWGAANIGLYHIGNKRSAGVRVSAWRIVASLSAYASSGYSKRGVTARSDRCHVLCHALHMHGQACQPSAAQLNLACLVGCLYSKTRLPRAPSLCFAWAPPSPWSSGLTACDQCAWADA